MGEFAKFVDYKADADTLILKLKRENEALLGSNNKRQARIENFEKVIIPNLNQTYEKERLKNENNSKIFEIEKNQLEYKLKEAIKKKWNWGIWGLTIGSVIGFLLAITL